jgi:hypothetical protein
LEPSRYFTRLSKGVEKMSILLVLLTCVSYAYLFLTLIGGLSQLKNEGMKPYEFGLLISIIYLLYVLMCLLFHGKFEIYS